MKEIIIGGIVTLLLGLITWIFTILYKKNILYSEIIRDFREKLPRPQNQGRVLSDEEKKQHPFLPKSFQYITVIDKSTHKTSITESDLDTFFNKLIYFDYSFVLFKKYYKKHRDNILRFKPKPENKDFELIVLQRVVEEEDIHPIKFQNVLWHHFKWEWKLTSWYFKWKVKG